MSKLSLHDFFFYLGFLSQLFMKHRTVEEGGGDFVNSSLPLPPTSRVAILKIIRTEQSLAVTCTVCRPVILSNFNIAELLNDHILFQEYTPFKFVCSLHLG